ncbi:carbohydrate kinase family protein [Oribacterium sp. HCP28S3_H8]|uniref:carbohydrate kinase family protein n=1 Tax=Oribacterium sp. HCP28S3_H8 TaxID=3438945 RepID=UPI003F8A2CA9
MGIVVIGSVFVDIKGYPLAQYVPDGRNAGYVVQVHGGVSRNVAEDIANVELRPTFLSIVDESGTGTDVINKLKRHHVNTDYIIRQAGGLGTWLAVFDNDGDVVASISQRPNLDALGELLDTRGDEIFRQADSIVVEIDMEPYLLKKIFKLADKFQKKVYAVVSNMSIAMERRDLLKRTGCIVCNNEEAGLLFSEDYSCESPEKLQQIIARNVTKAQYAKMVVTLGASGAVWADSDGHSGYCPPVNVAVVDTTGAGDAFFAGVTIGLTYGKSLEDACYIGTRLASSVISTKENVCPRFLPSEFDLELVCAESMNEDSQGTAS